MEDTNKILVLGIGNPILSDDGIGIHVVNHLRREVNDEGIDIKETSVSGLGIIDLTVGYDKLILVDAIKTDNGKIGEIYKLSLDDLPTLHFSTPHDVDIKTALELGKKFGKEMPKEILIYAIEVKNIREFKEGLTPEVERAVPKAVKLIKKELNAR